MGTVCRICDRKFFLRLTYQDFATELMQLEALTDQVQGELQDQQEVLTQIMNDTALYNQQIIEEDERFQAVMIESAKDLEFLQNQKDQLSKQRDELKLKVETRRQKHVKTGAQLQQQEMELNELRLKVERERNDKSLKNTEVSRFSEFQS